MTEYTELVEKRRIYLDAEEWGNKVSMHYVCKGVNKGDLGYGEGYFVYYNNGAVHRIDNGNKISIMQTPNPIVDVIDDYIRSKQC